MNNILNFKSEHNFALKAALFILSCIEETIEKQGLCSIILAGGNTPQSCYKRLSALIKERDIPVGSMYWFFGDERWVPVDNPQSNEGMARRLLLDPLDVMPDHVFSWHVDGSTPIAGARRYQGILDDFFKSCSRSPDICLLGMGDDGHTASLFPRSRIVTPDQKSIAIKKDIKADAVAVLLADNKTYRLSLTPHFLNTSKNIIFLIRGQAKRKAFSELRTGSTVLPASWIKGKNLSFFVGDEVLAHPG
ncbi:MAG: 6-phosphogluconolactonase [Spirochaetia bacterium]